MPDAAVTWRVEEMLSIVILTRNEAANLESLLPRWATSWHGRASLAK